MGKCHCVFLTQNLKQLKVPRQKKLKSQFMQLCANRRPSLPPSPLLWNIRTTLSSVKSKSNAVYLQITDNMCDMRQIYENSTVLPALQKTRNVP